MHELLRLELVRRIERGTLTGTEIAQRTGFRQAHISNFLNRRRALSLEGLDRVLAAQNLTIEQILPLALAATSAMSATDTCEAVPVVTHTSVLDEPSIPASAILETIQVPIAMLHHHRVRPSPRHIHWQRFVAVRLDRAETAPMEPALTVGSIAVLDRHYNTITPYRAHQPTILAARCGKGVVFRYIDYDVQHLILRPHNLDYPVELLPLAANESPSDRIVGRICIIFSEM
ncbi:MAG: helix-turn-helix domain-containing protein [Acidobacteriaceae bacterium]